MRASGAQEITLDQKTYCKIYKNKMPGAACYLGTGRRRLIDLSKGTVVQAGVKLFRGFLPYQPPSPSPPPPSQPAIAGQDPHFHFAHGGQADFRGRNSTMYAFFSAPGLAVNIKTEDASFRFFKNGWLIVHGSFITEAHLVALVGNAPRLKFANVSFWASELNDDNWGWRIVTGTCGGHAFKLGKGGLKKCYELAVEVDMASATFTIRDWTVVVHGNHVFNRLSGPQHRLDLTFNARGDVAARALPHGLIGQSYSSAAPRHGRQDEYPDGSNTGEPVAFTTSAMAEGAIEGEAAMYEVPSAHATEFAFSRFFQEELPEPLPDLLGGGGDASSIEVQSR